MSRKLKQIDPLVGSSKGGETNKKEVPRIPEIELREYDGISTTQEDSKVCEGTGPRIVYK